MRLLISLMRAEGPTAECDHIHLCGSFGEANAVLRHMANSAPMTGYDKVDFRITSEEANLNYRGRYDLKHWRVEIPCLKSHVLGHLLFIAGEAKPAHMHDDKYRAMLADVYRFSEEFRRNALALHNQLKEEL